MSRPYAVTAVIGKAGEKLAEDILIPYLFPEAVVTSVAVRDQKWLHVDYFLTFPDGKRKMLEIKNDTYKSGNIVAETQLTYVKTGLVVPGWYWKSKADYILYILGAFKQAYLLDLARLRLMVDSGKYTKKKTNRSDDGSVAEFYLIPKKDLDAYGFESIMYEHLLENNAPE